MAKIELDHISYRYPDQAKDAPVLQDISLRVEEGEFVCIVGQSGCGKTTLLRLLAGLSFPTEGTLQISGQPVTGPCSDCSIVFQSYPLFPWMSARRNVEFGIRQTRRELSRTQARQIAEEFLRKVDMLRDADKYPYQMSGGMRQRVALARSLAMDTGILLLDEPFGALDARIRRELHILLESLCAGETGKRKTTILVTHDIREAVFLADRILYMTQGRIVQELTVPLSRPRSQCSEADRGRMRDIRQQLLGLFDQAYGRLEA